MPPSLIEKLKSPIGLPQDLREHITDWYWTDFFRPWAGKIQKEYYMTRLFFKYHGICCLDALMIDRSNWENCHLPEGLELLEQMVDIVHVSVEKHLRENLATEEQRKNVFPITGDTILPLP